MRLNPDCIRAILLEVEKLKLNQIYSFSLLCENLPNYSEDDIQYTCVKLIEANYLIGSTIKAMGISIPMVADITDLTYSGHEFLNTVRSKSVWEKTKSAVEAIGGASLPVILDAAKDISVSLLLSNLNP